MAEPTTKQEIVRVEGNERIDVPDFQQLTRGSLGLIESVVGKLFAQGAVVSGFNARANPADDTAVQVVRDSGAFIALDRGGVDRPWPAGVDAQSFLFDVGGAASVSVALGGFSPGQLHVYILFAWTASRYEERAFWDATPPTSEFKENINTRYLPTWSVQVLEHDAAVPTGAVRVATIAWDGAALVSGDVQKAKQALYEGAAVPGGSTAVVPANGGFAGFTAPVVLPDFDRDDERGSHGLDSFATFAQAVLKCIEEVKDGNYGRWWRAPQHSLRAMPYTFTIGPFADDATGGGDYIAASDGDITAALLAIASITLDNVLASPVTIFLKPGTYKTTGHVAFGQLGWRLIGAGMRLTTLALGNFRLDASSSSVLRTQIADLTITSTSGSACVRVNRGCEIERVGFSSSVANSVFLGKVANGLSTTNIVLRDCVLAGSISYDGLCPIQLYNCSLQDVIRSDEDARMDVVGCTLRSIQASYGNIFVRASTIGCIELSGLTRDVEVRDCTFSGEAAVGATSKNWRFSVSQSNVPSTAHIVVSGCTFYALSNVAGVRAVIDQSIDDHFSSFDVVGCAFVCAGTTPTVSSSGAAVNHGVGVVTGSTPFGWSSVRNCKVVDFASSAFVFANVENCVVDKLTDEGLTYSVFTHCLVRGARVSSTLATCTYLAFNCPLLERVTANVPLISTSFTTWQIDMAFNTMPYGILRDFDTPAAVGVDWHEFGADITMERCTFGAGISMLHPGGYLAEATFLARDWLVGGNISITVYDGMGAALRFEHVLASGFIRLNPVSNAPLYGSIASVAFIGCIAEQGMQIVGDQSVVRGTCEIRSCVLWPRGDVSGTPGGPLTVPSTAWALVIDSAFDSIIVTDCELRAVLLDTSASTPWNNLWDAAVWLSGANKVRVERCRCVFTAGADTAIDTFRPFRLAGREMAMVDNTIALRNDAGAAVVLGRLVTFLSRQFVDGVNASWLPTFLGMAMRFDGNDVDFQAGVGGIYKLGLKTSMLEYTFPAADHDETILLSVCRNMVAFDAESGAKLARNTTGTDTAAGLFVRGVWHDNLMRDRQGIITALSTTTVAVTRPTATQVFDFDTVSVPV
jgi:hypothetical protein